MKYLIPYNKHPHRNLPPEVSRKRTEANLVLAFGRIYYQESDCTHIKRELYIPNLGIADVVSLSGGSPKHNLHAFEVKIKGWRKALAQAYRYKYYANYAFVVLPLEEAFRAKEFVSLFREMNVGLWAFNVESGIKKIYNPKRDNVKSGTAYNKALSLLLT